MDERIEKAFETANYMATLSNQKRIIKEEFDQQLVYYINGGTFQITINLISYVKTLIDLKHTTPLILVDSNNIPIAIDDIDEFLNKISNQYLSACQTYYTKYSDLRIKRKIKDIIEL
jgi:hypothetical protein